MTIDHSSPTIESQDITSESKVSAKVCVLHNNNLLWRPMNTTMAVVVAFHCDAISCEACGVARPRPASAMRVVTRSV